MRIGGHDIGVCSWSLQPKGTAHLVEMLKQLGVEHVQLALGPIVQLDDKRKFQELGHLRTSGLTVTAGMISFPGEDYSSIDSIRETGGYVPDEQWPLRKRMSVQAAQLAAELGVGAVSTHVGFIPPPEELNYSVMVDRVRQVAEAFRSHDVRLLMETGQERADELLQFLKDVGTSNVFVNFDPANMILYGAGDPIEALNVLEPHVAHVHVKDGTPSAKPGVEWGEEVPFGTGAVDVKAFLSALRSAGYAGPLVIEREAGNSRMEDVRTAIQTLRSAAA